MNELKISHRGKPVKWQESEIEFIKNNLGKLSDKEIGLNLNRNPSQIMWFRRKNNLKKDSSSICKSAFAEGRKIHPMIGRHVKKESIEKRNKTIKERYGKLKSWSNGLTKETDARLRISGVKMSKSKKGVKNPKLSYSRKWRYALGTLPLPMLGKTKENSEWARRMSERMKNNNPMKNPETVNKANRNPIHLKKRLNSMMKRPTLPEKILLDLVREYNLPFKYVGNGQVIIGGFNPDFISEETKSIIEVFGDYWHNLPKYAIKDKLRVQAYNENGYRVTILWEKELKNESKQQILAKINGEYLDEQ